MQGEADQQRDVLDVESVAGHLLPAGSVFAFLGEHRSRLFPAEMFTDLFPSRRGRPSVPPEVMASVLVLQALHGLSDREAVDAVTFDLRWKAACGYPIDAAGFHPSTLTYWRRRLAASDRPNRIFDAVRQVIVETGVLAGKHRRAVDSTILDDAVARQDTVTQLIAAIRKVVRVVDGADQIVAERCTRLAQVTGAGYEHTGKPAIAWDDHQAREDLVSALVEDARALLDGLDLEAIEKAGGDRARAVALLALVAGQDVEPADGSDGTDGRWKIARRTVPDRVISTVDPQARHAHKTRERRQDGYRAHVTIEPDTGLTTECVLTPAAGVENTDAAVGSRMVADDPTLPDHRDQSAAGDAGIGDRSPVEILGDSAYATGEFLDDLEKSGRRAVLKPKPLKAAVEGGFTLDDYVFDDQEHTLTCPAGHTKPVTDAGRATFKTECRGCPLREQCTTSKTGRIVLLGKHHKIARAHRQRAQDPEFQRVYRRHRPMVERTIAWLARGNRRLRYIGVEKNDHWLHRRIAGINLRRLLAMGLTVDSGAWTIA